MDISGRDVFDAINQVRSNPSLVLNEIKEQFKRYP